MDIFSLILDLVFPKFCSGCGKEGKYICDKCSVFVSESSLICPVCGQTSFTGETHLQCGDKYGLDGLISVWDFDGIIKEAIKNAKYGGTYDILKELVESSFKIFSNDTSNRFDEFLSFLIAKETYIVCVSMFNNKEKERGFNQAQIIAKELARIAGKKFISLLQKTRETKDQASLDKEARLKNLKNSFIITKLSLLKLSSPQAVLVDDVFTTGATMKECCKVLKENGVQRVWGFVLARPN